MSSDWLRSSVEFIALIKETVKTTTKETVNEIRNEPKILAEIIMLLEGTINEITFLYGIGTNILKNTKDKNGNEIYFGGLLDLFINGFYDGIRLSAPNVALDQGIAQAIEQGAEQQLNSIYNPTKILDEIKNKYNIKKTKIDKSLNDLKDVNIKDALLREDIFPQNLIKKVIHKNYIQDPQPSKILSQTIVILEGAKAVIDTGASITISGIPSIGHKIGATVGFLCTYLPAGEEMIRDAIETSLKTYINNQHARDTFSKYLAFSFIKDVISLIISLVIAPQLNFFRAGIAGVYEGLTEESIKEHIHIKDLEQKIGLVPKILENIKSGNYTDFDTVQKEIVAKIKEISKQENDLQGDKGLSYQQNLIKQLKNQINNIQQGDKDINKLEKELEVISQDGYIKGLCLNLLAEKNSLESEFQLIHEAARLGNTLIPILNNDNISKIEHIKQNLLSSLPKMEKELLKLQIAEKESILHHEKFDKENTPRLFAQYEELQSKLADLDTWKSYCTEIIEQQIRDYKTAKNTQIELGTVNKGFAK
ncbi:hypothetical protein Cyrtocomes_00638 [Candidatus Cyrtobacter comes]|uniref:Uncharacterized protein n=1 Tax=Candidatus Cyrtobacter comes TaxID=675776 RepID=A0ABU5L8L8_9RICK|nr:hypothetical protein [Candidatus Cyrtobacter comes]MDZ5762260.1 hypothetical protein [Candidatus Cyrtobacter comes]